MNHFMVLKFQFFDVDRVISFDSVQLVVKILFSWPKRFQGSTEHNRFVLNQSIGKFETSDWIGPWQNRKLSDRFWPSGPRTNRSVDSWFRKMSGFLFNRTYDLNNSLTNGPSGLYFVVLSTLGKRWQHIDT